MFIGNLQPCGHYNPLRIEKGILVAYKCPCKVACGFCGAKPGESCRTSTSYGATPHRIRLLHAIQQGVSEAEVLQH